MLSLQMKDGEYLTIGEDIVVQVFTSAAVRVAVQAPKDMTILRGEVRERSGKARPECLGGGQSAEAAQVPKNDSVSSG